MLDCGDESKTDRRHERGIRGQCADVESDLNETYRHEDGGSEEGHPTRKALGRFGQVNKRKRKKHDKNRPDRLQPSSPKYKRIVLLAELDQLSAGRGWRGTIINAE